MRTDTSFSDLCAMAIPFLAATEAEGSTPQDVDTDVLIGAIPFFTELLNISDAQIAMVLAGIADELGIRALPAEAVEAEIIDASDEIDAEAAIEREEEDDADADE
jgi:hypothetical protein